MLYYGETIDGQPVTKWPEIHEACCRYRRFAVEVRKWDEDREVTNQQFAYLHSVVFVTIAKEKDMSLLEAELECKRQCGEQWLIKKVGDLRFVLSKTVLTAKECNQWIENIWAYYHSQGIIIPLPDKDWRETLREMAELRGEEG